MSRWIDDKSKLCPRQLAHQTPKNAKTDRPQSTREIGLEYDRNRRAKSCHSVGFGNLVQMDPIIQRSVYSICLDEISRRSDQNATLLSMYKELSAKYYQLLSHSIKRRQPIEANRNAAETKTKEQTIAELIQENRKLKIHISELERAPRDEREAFIDKIYDIQHENKTLCGHIRYLLAKKDVLTKEVDNLNYRLHKVKSEYAQYEESKTTEIEELKTQLATVNVHGLEQELKLQLDALRYEISTLKAQKLSLQGQIKTQENNKKLTDRKYEVELNKMKDSNSRLNDEVLRLQNEKKIILNEKRRLEMRINDAIGEVEKKMASITSQKETELALLRTTISKYERDLSRLTAERSSLRKEVDVLNSDVLKAKQCIETVERDRSNLRAKVCLLQQKIDEPQGRLDTVAAGYDLMITMETHNNVTDKGKTSVAEQLRRRVIDSMETEPLETTTAWMRKEASEKSGVHKADSSLRDSKFRTEVASLIEQKRAMQHQLEALSAKFSSAQQIWKQSTADKDEQITKLVSDSRDLKAQIGDLQSVLVRERKEREREINDTIRNLTEQNSNLRKDVDVSNRNLLQAKETMEQIKRESNEKITVLESETSRYRNEIEAGARQRIQPLESEKRRLQETVDELKGKFTAVSKQNKILKERSVSNAKQEEDAHREIDALKNALTDAENKIIELRENAKANSDEYERERRTIDSKQIEEISKLNDQNMSLHKRIEELQSKSKEAYRDYKQSIEEKDKQIKKLEGDKMETDTKCSIQQRTNSDLQDRMDRTQAELDKINDNTDLTERESIDKNRKLEEENKLLRSHYETEKVGLERTIRDCRNTISDLKERNSDLTKDIDYKVKEVSSLRKANSDLASEMLSLKSKQSSKSETEEKVRDLESKLAEEENNRRLTETKWKTEIEKLEKRYTKQIEELCVQLDQTVIDQDRLSSDLAKSEHSLQQTRLKAKERIQTLESEKYNLGAIVDRLRQNVDELKGQLKDITSEYDRIRMATGSENETDISKEKRRLTEQLQRAETDSGQFHELKYLKEQLHSKEQELIDIKKELETTKTRLSKLMGDKLTHNNPNIADLGDKNRPTNLAERFGELYDNQWTDAYEIFEDEYSEERIIHILLSILQDVNQFCIDETEGWMLNLLKEMTNSDTPQQSDVPESVLKYIKDRRKASAPKMMDDKFKKYLRELSGRSFPFVKEALRVQEYVKECFEVCWLMAIQDPPVVIAPILQRSATFRGDLYNAYTASGGKVDFTVWPALLLHDSGPLLKKGVAQGLKGT